MKWSKLKQRVEASFAESVKGRISIFTTSYRRQDETARSWVVIDGAQVISLTDEASWWFQRANFHELTPTDCVTHKSIDDSSRTEGLLHEPGEFSSYDFKIMAFEYLNTSAHNCLVSAHPLLRVLGVLNKKTGKERAKLLLADPHPMVAYFARFRVDSDVAYKSRTGQGHSGVVEKLSLVVNRVGI